MSTAMTSTVTVQKKKTEPKKPNSDKQKKKAFMALLQKRMDMSFTEKLDFKEALANAKDQEEYEKIEREYDEFFSNKPQLFKISDFDVGMTIG